jgi:hypothetical protein
MLEMPLTVSPETFRVQEPDATVGLRSGVWAHPASASPGESWPPCARIPNAVIQPNPTSFWSRRCLVGSVSNIDKTGSSDGVRSPHRPSRSFLNSQLETHTQLTMSRIRIREAIPAEAPVLVDIHFGAFGPGVMSQLMHPGGVTDDAKVKFGATLFPAPGDNSKPGVEVKIWVAELRPEPGQGGDAKVVAFAKWLIYHTERPEEQWNVEVKPMTAEMLGDGCSAEAVNWFLGGLHKKARPLIRGEANACKCHLPCCSWGPDTDGLDRSQSLRLSPRVPRVGCRVRATPTGLRIRRQSWAAQLAAGFARGISRVQEIRLSKRGCHGL